MVKNSADWNDDDGGLDDHRHELIWLCFSALFLLSSIIMMSLTGYLGSFSGSKVTTEFKVLPVVELRSKFTQHNYDHHKARAVSYEPSSSSSSSSINSSSFLRNHRKPTIIREDEKVEHGLVIAREAIRKAAINFMKNNRSVFSNISVYRNPGAFYRSYAEMEKRFKVYVYGEGELPIVHAGPCKDIYTSEGRFIHEMEHGANGFRTKDLHSAHVFFMPFSVTWMVKYLYKPNTYDVTPLKGFVADYVRVISKKYLFWNRSSGADHFMLACHDWGPHASRGNPLLYNTSIRVLCNANSSEGFNPQKDVSLPEINLYDGYIPAKLRSIPPPNTPRPYLAFFAGGVHGPIRPILLHHWKGRDPNLPVHEYLPKGLDYSTFLLQSKFCLCPSGYEVASPRIVESVYAECVPVILSEHYVLPFSDVLNWEAFSIKVEIDDIPRLKEVLMAVPEEKYLRLKMGLKAVRKHFVLNHPAKRFDVFHMILHSVWLRRLNFRIG